MNKPELSAQYFLSALSHEIRTPLNGVVGYMQLLNQTRLDNNQQLYVNNVNNCCVQLMELVNDIIDFCKLSTGKAKLNPSCFSIKEIVEDVNSTVSYRIKEKEQKLTYIISEHIPKYIVADKNKIIQILINLITNANKFTQSKGRIIVSIEPYLKDHIQISVEDNGQGISEQDQKKLFNAFVQVKESATKNGSGLGLAICKKLVELMSGTISVQSEKTQGATFIFDFKYENYDNFQKSIEDNAVILKHKHILIIDDNLDSRLEINQILYDIGMEPTSCSSHKEAFQIVAKRKNFITIILSTTMSHINSSEIVRKIKETAPDIPLIALSPEDSYDKKYYIDIITKPVNKVKLLAVIISVFNKNSIDNFQLNEIENKQNVSTTVRILITEDVNYNLEMLKRMLNSMGYNNIDTAINGQQAIEKIDQSYIDNNPYDILLLDLIMPIKDGFEVAKHCQEKNYKTRIAVISASILDNDKNRCKNLNIKYFLQKPFNMNHLRMIINKLIYGTI